eukprot:1070231-Pyramimonas_sp.AAC.1
MPVGCNTAPRSTDGGSAPHARECRIVGYADSLKRKKMSVISLEAPFRMGMPSIGFPEASALLETDGGKELMAGPGGNITASRSPACAPVTTAPGSRHAKTSAWPG